LVRALRSRLVILAVVGAVLLGGVATAFAVGGDRDGDDIEAPALKGSVPVPNKDNSSDDEAGEAQELQKLAEIDQSAPRRLLFRKVQGR
jgi:hypothetical protein